MQRVRCPCRKGIVILSETQLCVFTKASGQWALQQVTGDALGCPGEGLLRASGRSSPRQSCPCAHRQPACPLTLLPVLSGAF